MVQLSSPALDVSPPPERSEEGKKFQGSPKNGSPKMGSPGGLSALQLALAVSTTTYQGYENYIEDGLICLKHKIRNLEKKKLKLEDYTTRLRGGGILNKDQLEAVQKYEEVIHNLAFARELHQTLDGLTQDLLRAQKKAVKKEQVAKGEVERRRLSMVLQVQHILHSLQQEHIRKDLLSGHNQAPHLPAHKLQSLLQLAALLGVQRVKGLSLGKQMEKSSLVYLDLLEGKDKPVAGSTFKLMKEELHNLLDCEYFNHLPPPPPPPSPSKIPKEVERKALLPTTTLSALAKSNTNEVSKKEFLNRLYLTDTGAPPTQNWKAEFQAMKEREPPDTWDMEFSDRPGTPQPIVHKPWRGAATLIPKVTGTIKKPPADGKQGSPAPAVSHGYGKMNVRKKSKGEQNTKAPSCTDTPVEVFNSPSSLPKDPILRKQHLEDLITKIHGSFSFMQDSHLDGESSPTNGHPRPGRLASGSPSPLAQGEFSDGLRDLRRSPVDSPPTTMRSTPLPPRLMVCEGSLTNGELALESCDLELTTEDLPHEPLQLSDSEAFPSPPLYCRESAISVSLEEKSQPRTPVTESGKQSPCNGVAPRTPTPPKGQDFSTPPSRRSLTLVPPAPFQNMHSVFKVSTPLPLTGDLEYKPDTMAFSEIRYSTASTQTPPEFSPPEDELQPVYPSEYMVGNGGQVYLSPGQSGGGMGRSGQSYYRGSVRGMARGGKGLAHSFRSSGWHRGIYPQLPFPVDRRRGTFIPQTHLRDYGPVLYGARDHVYQHSSRRSGVVRHNSSASWSDSSQVSSPDLEGTFTILDSGHGDSLSVSTVEMPVTPHGTLLPLQLYPLTQPLRVAFTSSRTVNFAPGTLDQPIVFDQLHSNLGDMYDAHIGRFTCPVNGTYVFIFHILKLAVNVPLYINLMRNEEVMVSAYANDGAPDHETASNHAILPLYQGDQVWLRLHRGAIYGSTWKYSTFSGFLLYQD